MLRASLYIIVCSAKNRARLRLRRLREPRYLAGAIAGGAYMYFSIFGRFRGRRAATARRRRSGGSLSELPWLGPVLPPISGMALMAFAAVSWAAPLESGLLEFSDAEMQFLFPAPISRRELLIHRMLRSQIGLLFGALIVGVAVPSASGSNRLMIGAATWFLMATAKVYFTGVSLTRARIRAAPSRAAGWVVPALLLVAVAIVVTALTRAFVAASPSSISDALRLVLDVST